MRFFAPIALLALGGSFAHATPLPSCTTFTTLQQFVDAGSSGCNYGSTLLSSFAWTDTGGVSGATLAASSVDTTITSNPASATFQLNFASSGFTESSQTLAYDLTYQITPSSPYIRQAAASLSTVSVGSGGSVSLVETVDNGSTIVVLTPTSPSWSASGAVSGASYSVTNSLSIAPGTSSSSIASLANIYTVPEPGSLLLVGTALAVAGLFRRRLFAK